MNKGNTKFKIQAYITLAKLVPEDDPEQRQQYIDAALDLLENLGDSNTSGLNNISANDTDDPEFGCIEVYCAGKQKVCLLEIWRNALFSDSSSAPKMTRKDSLRLANILTERLGYIRGDTSYFGNYGRQKAYYISSEINGDADD